MPHRVAAVVLCMQADAGITLSGSDVTGWTSTVGTAAGTQGTAADRPSIEATGWRTGKPQVRFDRANTEKIDLGSFAPSGQSYTCIAVLDLITTGVVQQLLGASPAAFISIIAADHGGQVAVFDGTAWRDIGAAVTGEQVLTWVLDAGASQIRARRNGAPLGSAVTYDNTWDWTAPREIGGSDHGHSNLELAEIIFANAALSATETAALELHARLKYALP